MQNLSHRNEFDLHENEPVGETHFHVNGFALRLVLTQKQKATQKWPIGNSIYSAKESLTPPLNSFFTIRYS